MRHRICKNKLGTFKIQRKGWIFWHDVENGWTTNNPRAASMTFKSHEEAEKRLAGYLKRKDGIKDYQQKRDSWECVGEY